MMTALSATPWWVIPGVIGAMLGLTMTVFGLGLAVQKRRGDVITHAILREKMDACQNRQLDANTVILNEVRALSAERRDIWEIVRGTASAVGVMQNDLDWVKAKLSSNGRV
jgi:hypothetical protein